MLGSWRGKNVAQITGMSMLRWARGKTRLVRSCSHVVMYLMSESFREDKFTCACVCVYVSVSVGLYFFNNNDDLPGLEWPP